jgi:hypothetical protein
VDGADDLAAVDALEVATGAGRCSWPAGPVFGLSAKWVGNIDVSISRASRSSRRPSPPNSSIPIASTSLSPVGRSHTSADSVSPSYASHTPHYPSLARKGVSALRSAARGASA